MSSLFMEVPVEGKRVSIRISEISSVAEVRGNAFVIMKNGTKIDTKMSYERFMKFAKGEFQ